MHKRFIPMNDAIHARSESELGFNPVDVTVRSLSLLTGNLRQFVESALGRDASSQWKKITKFPHHLFFDYSPSGALDIMLCACLNFKALHGLRRLEFSNIDKRDFYMDLLRRIHRNLLQAGLIPAVKVFLAPNVDSAHHAVLRAIVQKRGLMVGTAASATHIVYPDPDGTAAEETEGTDYCRALQYRENAALVHWWYYPDSYDSWISREDVDGPPEPPEVHKGPWHVQTRWLHDSEMFNEWMNETDYEIPDDSRMAVTSMATAVKNKSEPEKAPRKRKRLPTTSSSNHQTDPTQVPRASRLGVEASSKADSSDDSDDEAVRKPKRHSESARERKRKEPGNHGKSGDGSAKKRARTAEGTEQKSGSSIQVRLPLKPPHDRPRHRSKDRHRDRKGEGTRAEGREGRMELKEGNLRVKLPKFGDAKRTGDPDKKSSSKDAQRDSPNENASSANRFPTSRGIEERSSTGGKAKDGGKAGPSALPPKPDQKANGGENIAGEQEQKRPFSRRRSKKKERRSHSRMSGVSVVDDAIPIPEGDIPRIRNISTEGGSAMSPNAASGSEAGEGEIDAGEKKDADEVSAKPKRKVSTVADEAMDVDSGDGNGRIMALSEKMLSGDRANDPVSTADVVEALPPVTVRIPPQSRWFRMDAVHDIERRSLPEFWNSRGESKTPLVYKKYRDFMIDVWRQSPDKHLTATAARRHLAGDVSAILRVHAFLEYWGLINYGTEPESRPFLNSALLPRRSRPTPMQLDSNVAAPATGVPRLLFFDEPRPPRRDNGPVSLQKAVKAAKEKGTRARSHVLSRRELYATAAATKYECDACGKDCSRMRYHCVGNADMELCPTCFANGMYPAIFSARDFEQLTTVLASEAYDGSVWSEAEVLLLLEGLEKHGDNWNQVAEHVGTKGTEQCVLQFLRMPLEDSFLEDQVGNWAMGEDGEEGVDDVKDTNASGKHHFSGPLLPFYDTANPIMAQVAFLASSVDPEVAAAAAQAALNAITSQSGPKSPKQGSRTAQAEALLMNPAQQKRSSTENGFSPNAGTARGTEMSSLPGKQLDAVAVESVAAVGLAAAASKALHKAQAEMREIERRYAVAIETKMRAVDLKVKEFERLNQHLRRERERLEKQRQRVFADRVDAIAMRIQSEEQSRAMAMQSSAAVVHPVASMPQLQPQGALGPLRPPPGISGIPMHHGRPGLQHSQLPMQQMQLPMHQNQTPLQQGQLLISHTQLQLPQGQGIAQHPQTPVQQGTSPLPPSAVSAPLGVSALQPGTAQAQHQAGMIRPHIDGGPNK